MSDQFTVTARAWRLRTRLAKKNDKPHVLKVYSVLKKYGPRNQNKSYEELTRLRDSNVGKPQEVIYSRGADDALKMVSRLNDFVKRVSKNAKHR
jgi:hypothetical protein